jgi:hypothetical protein
LGSRDAKGSEFRNTHAKPLGMFVIDAQLTQLAGTKRSKGVSRI